MSLSFTKPPKVPDTEEVEPEHIDKAWPPPPYGFVVTPPGYTRASQSPVPGASGARMPLPHPLQLSELRPTYNQYILADGTHMQRRSPAFSISLWTGEMLIFSTIASIAVNFTSAYLANSLQPPRVRRALALSASVRNVSKTAPRIAFMSFCLLSTFAASRLVTRYRSDGVMVEPLIGFFGGLFLARKARIGPPVILRSGHITGGTPFVIPLVFATFGALFGYWFVHGTGASMGDPNNRITFPDPTPHEYVFGADATKTSVSIWNLSNIEFPPSRPMLPFVLPPNNSFAAKKSEPTINSTALPVTSTEKKDKWD